MTSDKHERELIEAAIREAHEQRSIAIAQGLRAAAVWLKKEFAILMSHVKNHKTTTSLTHTEHAA